MSRALIITYHAIESGPPPLCVHPDLFRSHVETVLAAGARVVSISELVRELAAPTSGGRLVAFTFDDGFASVATAAAPILASRGLVGTVFCVAGHVGGANDWETGRNDFAAPLLSGEQIRELVSAGLEIGSHGFAHRPAAELREDEAEEEIVGSRKALEILAGTEVRTFAYPYGALPSPAVRGLVDGTYDAACTTRLAEVGDRPDLHALPRVDAHYLRRPELLHRAVSGSLGPYLAVRRLGARARRVVRPDYVPA